MTATKRLDTRPVLALDIGGTKLAAGVVLPDGGGRASDTIATRATATADVLFGDLAGLCDRVLARAGLDTADLAGVGVGCGGPMVYPEGRVSPLNIPAWRDFPLRDRLAERYRRPVVVDNDAKAFALGEYRLGAGRGAECLLGMVVSTGVGGGIVEAGRLVHGASGNAGHIGHLIAFPNGAPCACGARGCVEAVASGSGLARRAASAISRGTRTEVVRGATAAEIADAARRGDPLGTRLMREAAVALGRGIAGATTLLDLDRVVIGGSVALRAGDLLLDPLRAELARDARLEFARGVTVVLSELGVSAALAGAAALVLQGASS